MSLTAWKPYERIQFIPRPRHNRETDFPSIAFKSNPTADYILGLDKKLKEKAVEIMNVHIIPDKEPA